MIKVNLLNDIVSSGPSAKKGKTFALTTVDLSLSGDSAENVAILVRIGVFLLPLICLIGYRWYVQIVTDANYRALQAEYQAIQTQLKALEPAVRELEKFQEEKNKLTSQLQAIKLLSTERLKNVKSLDVIQSIIPSRAWLTELKIADRNVDFEGMATDDLVISEFMQGLQSSIYFSNIRLISSEEVKRPEGTAKKYKIKANLENM